MIDLSPVPSPKMHNVNVEGTRTLLSTCIQKRVSYFIYTSSIDAVFSGNPIRDGDESLPYCADGSITPYGYTKAQAEELVLGADREGFMRTAALRPSHIYGPHDPMISQVLVTVAKDEAPFMFGDGHNDYIYVDNCAAAHFQCLEALIAKPGDVAGQAFFISDIHCPMWVHMGVFLLAHKLQAPSMELPLTVVRFYAYILHLVSIIASYFHISFVPLLTRYTVLAVGQDFWFSTKKARAAFYHPVVQMQEARMRTVHWVLTLQLDRKEPLRWVHVLHLVYGVGLLVLGCLQFLFPSHASDMLGLDSTPFPAPTAVLSQTAGLIVAVLGVYSVVAAVARYSVTFFQVTLWAKLMTGAIFLLHVRSGRVPPELAYAGAMEILVALLTLTLCFGNEFSISFRFDRVTAAQLLHAIASGLFAAALMVRPARVLPFVVSDSQAATSHTALVWATCMGTWEWMMTWTYTASALVVQLEPFVRLSVWTRLGALLAFSLSFIAGNSSPTQLAGVMPDAVLALLSLWALSRQRRRKYD